MHHDTRKKIKFLQAHLRRNAKRYYRLDPDGITGVRVGRKVSGGREKPRLSIIFHVKVKRLAEQLTRKQTIPEKLKIKFPDGVTRSVPTDVRQTGEFRFQLEPVDTVQDGITHEQGSAALFLTDNSANVFLLTCFHVAANSLWRNGTFQFTDSPGRAPYPVNVNAGAHGRLFRGLFSPDMDAAFVFMGQNAPASNQLPDGRQINNVPSTAPMIVGENLTFYLQTTGGAPSVRPIVETAHFLHTPLVDFVDLIFVPNCSDHGDSGTAALDPSFSIVGIIYGGDESYTYVIPYYKIQRLMNLTII